MRELTDPDEIETVNRLIATGSMFSYPIPQFVMLGDSEPTTIVDGEAATFDEMSERKNGGYRIAATIHPRGRRQAAIVRVHCLTSLRRNLLYELLTFLSQRPTQMALWTAAPPDTAIPQGNFQVFREGMEQGALTRGAMAVGADHAARIGEWHAYTFNYPIWNVSQTGV